MRPRQPVEVQEDCLVGCPANVLPAEGASLVPMASIPHGTTIEALGTSFTVAGGPVIKPVDITPFPIGNLGPNVHGLPRRLTRDLSLVTAPPIPLAAPARESADPSPHRLVTAK